MNLQHSGRQAGLTPLQMLFWAVGVLAFTSLFIQGLYWLAHETAGSGGGAATSVQRRTWTSADFERTLSGGESEDPPLMGAELYKVFCIACHGENLEGQPVQGIRTPSLANPDFLSVASDRYLRTIIEKGRTGSAMAAWSQKHGGTLNGAQVQSLIDYIRSHEPAGPELSAISSKWGNPRYGRALYLGNCATCHGKQGQGGVGTALASSGFLKLASDRHIIHTIVNGRANTGMPSWKKLSAQQISDILSYLRSWQGPGADTETTLSLLQEGKGNKRIGKSLFRARCADCHGRKAEGGIGPSLANENFLTIVDDGYLEHAIRVGRPGTAMPSWTDLRPEDICDIITWLRSIGPRVEPRLPVAAATNGDKANGGELFAMACASCHGSLGTGGSGPQLANAAFQSRATEGFLFETIAHGRPGTAMRGFLRGSKGWAAAGGIVDFRARDIADIVAYVKSLDSGPIEPRDVTTVLGNAHRGEDIYNEKAACASCHGRMGEGGVGPALGTPEFLEQTTEAFLVGTMILGRDGTQMRNFGSSGISKLSQEDILDVAAYVRTLPDRKPVGSAGWRHYTAEGPLEVGAQLYAQNCASCHGHEGKGGYAPSLNNPQFLEAASDGFLVATIARGRQRTPMRSFGPDAIGMANLSANELRSLVGYIRHWQTTRTDKNGKTNKKGD